MLSLWIKVELRVMAIKGYSAFPKTPALQEPHRQIVSCHIRTLIRGVLSFCRDATRVFYSPSWLGIWQGGILFLIDFNGMSNHLKLFNAMTLENHIYCMVIFTLFVLLFLADSFFLFCKQIDQRSIWSINEPLTSIITWGKSGLGSNGNEDETPHTQDLQFIVIHISFFFREGV